MATVSALMFLVAACSDTPSGIDSTPTVLATGTIDRTGGVLSAASATFVLTMQPLGVLSATTFTVTRPASPLVDARVIPGSTFQLDPDTMYFNRTATLTLSYDPTKVPVSLAQESLQLYRLDGGGWQRVFGSTVNTTMHTVTGSIARAGIYGVRSTAVSTIRLDGTALGGALYVGQVSHIALAVFGEYDSLPSRPVTWTSSNPAVVKVDSLGTLTGVSVGSVVILAVTDGKTASTTVSVVPHPVANWGRGADWTTFQGNAQHNGYVDVSPDPFAFSFRWLKTPSPGVFFNQATVGNGRLFLVTNEGRRSVFAFNAADGTQLWVNYLGNFNGSNQATYDSGSVYVTTGGHENTFMHAFNAADGTLRFRTPFLSQYERWQAPVIAGPAIVTAGGYYGGMYGFDRVTGTQLFYNGGSQVSNWAPAVTAGLLYTTDGGVVATSPVNGNVVARITDARVTSVTTPVIGATNDLLTVNAGRLVSVNLTTQRVQWDQPAEGGRMPVVGGGVVYSINGGAIAARNESDGGLRWTWTPPVLYPQIGSMVLTNDLLFVSVTTGNPSMGMTLAIDLTAHTQVWGYPLPGVLSLNGDGVLYIVQGEKIGAISLR